MNPIQPFFTLSTDHYYKKIIYDHGISHIYCFTCEDPLSDLPSVLPDGCLDITFDLSAARPRGMVCGSVTNSETSRGINQEGHTYLGIRFEPGYLPSFIDGKLSDFVDQEVPLDMCCRDTYLTEKILCAREHALLAAHDLPTHTRSFVPSELGPCNNPNTDIGTLADLLIKECRTYDTQHQFSLSHAAPKTQATLLSVIERLITTTCGMIQIGKIEEETGYSRRYINEVFHEATGFSPKRMCEIIRFQSALEELTHDRTTPIADVALKYGYYDQPQFSRDIRKYLHETPRSYRSELQSAHYLERFVLV